LSTLNHEKISITMAETEKRALPDDGTAQHDAEHDAPSAVDRQLSGWVGLTVEARAATEHEHQMSLWEALKLYPRACWWSFVVSLVVIMDGYDTALIGTQHLESLQGTMTDLSWAVFRHAFRLPSLPAALRH
jgi:hypothetical protein